MSWYVGDRSDVISIILILVPSFGTWHVRRMSWYLRIPFWEQTHSLRPPRPENHVHIRRVRTPHSLHLHHCQAIVLVCGTMSP